MRKRGFSQNSGFTLIELIIVVIIIGILASIAGPIMQNMKYRAMAGEAVTTMSAIRQAIRQYYVTYNGYPSFSVPPLGSSLDTWADAWLAALGMDPASLDGAFFNKGCYLLKVGTASGSGDPNNYVIWAMPGLSEKTKGMLDDPSQPTSGSIMMYIVNGNIVQSGCSASGYPPEDNP